MNMDKFNKLRGVFCQLKAFWTPFKPRMCVQELQFLLFKIWSCSVTSVLLSTELWASLVWLPFSELTPLSNLSTVLQSQSSWVSPFILCGFFFSLLKNVQFHCIYLPLHYFLKNPNSPICPVPCGKGYPVANLEVEYALLDCSVLNYAIALERNGSFLLPSVCVGSFLSHEAEIATYME